MNQQNDQEDHGTNDSATRRFAEVLDASLSRRRVLLGGLSAAAAGVAVPLGLGALAPAADAGDAVTVDGTKALEPTRPALGFSGVSKNLLDVVTVPAGYQVEVLYALGDPIDDATAAFANDGTDRDYVRRAGDHHDGMYYFGIASDGTPDQYNSNRGLLAVNHENITQRYLHPLDATTLPDGSRPRSEVMKEMAAHGVGIVEIARDGAGGFAVDRSSPRNRRITASTPMVLTGPARGSRHVKTRYSPSGIGCRGTLNNCANGYTPWGTYLTCEENWNGYFRRGSGDEASALRSAADNAALRRYGVNPGNSGNYGWASVSGDVFERFNTSVAGTSADGNDDYRHEANTFGYVVEIDPYNPTSRPRKRTALGRFAHEGAWPARFEAGKPVVYYMGDDSRNEYIYKWVSRAVYDPADRGLAAGDKYFNAGTLYVARFNDDGSGEWFALRKGANGLNESNPRYPFATQADVCVNTRLAADSVGATKMDRPEWAAVDPLTGDVYFTLTNNSNRVLSAPSSSQTVVDAANPRSYSDDRAGSAQSGNVNGHIIRWREIGGNPAATAFQWDVFVFGAQADADPLVNLSRLTSANDFSSPDGLWFDPRGLLWIQTDDGAYTDVSNCMLLAAAPGQVRDGSPRAVGSVQTFMGKVLGAQRLRRFLVGPKQSEITGIDMTPDGTAMFVNIQHPGESSVPVYEDPATFGSHWPESQATGAGTARPRSATIVVRRTDGGVIGT